MNALKLDPTQMVDEIVERVFKKMKPLFKRIELEDEKFYTVATLAEHLGVSEQWIYNQKTNHEIPYIQLGKCIKFKKSDISKWLEGKKVPAIKNS